MEWTGITVKLEVQRREQMSFRTQWEFSIAYFITLS